VHSAACLFLDANYDGLLRILQATRPHQLGPSRGGYCLARTREAVKLQPRRLDGRGGAEDAERTAGTVQPQLDLAAALDLAEPPSAPSAKRDKQLVIKRDVQHALASSASTDAGARAAGSFGGTRVRRRGHRSGRWLYFDAKGGKA